MRARQQRRARGFAILMVVMMALILSSFAVIAWHMASTDQPIQEIIIEKKQAEYLAKGAQQHFLLKFRYLPTELYDAVAYSIGKNPYYDFGRQLDAGTTDDALVEADALVNPGPMFFFADSLQLDVSGPVPRVTRQANLESPSIKGVPADKARHRIRTLLRLYLLDVATMYPNDQDINAGIVVINSTLHTDRGMTDPGGGPQQWRDPFIGNYAVQDATILGLSGGKRYDKDSLLVTTIGSVRRAAQISLVTQGTVNGKRNLQKGRKYVSDLSFGNNEFPEAKVYWESIDKYNAKLADDDAAAVTQRDKLGLTEGMSISSGRRTEIATGIYHIQRQNP